jgi:hypothetical protein
MMFIHLYPCDYVPIKQRKNIERDSNNLKAVCNVCIQYTVYDPFQSIATHYLLINQ